MAQLTSVLADIHWVGLLDKGLDTDIACEAYISEGVGTVISLTAPLKDLLERKFLRHSAHRLLSLGT